jgi:hypothetical protein
MTEEFLPFLIGGGAVFVARPQRPPSSEERQVSLYRLFGIDGLVGDRDVDVSVACDDLGDVRWQTAHDRLRDEQPPKIVRRIAQGTIVDRIDEARVLEGSGEHVTRGVRAQPAVSRIAATKALTCGNGTRLRLLTEFLPAPQLLGLPGAAGETPGATAETGG